jgi:chromosomal replication initiation ATPase DnaA
MKPNAYKVFVLGAIGKKIDIFDKVYAGFFLGNKEFVKGKLDKFRLEVEAGDFAHKRKLNQDISIDDIISKVEAVFKESRDKIVAKKHSHSDARKVVIHAARRLTGLTNKQIGSYFGISDTAIIKADNNIVVLLQEDKGLKRKVNEILSAFRV